MLKKTRQSLHKLQNTLCNELKHLQLYHSSHKKAHSSSCLKTPTKSTTSMRLSDSKCVKNAKSTLVQSRSIVQKPKGEGKKGLYGDCQQLMRESRQHKLKKKGANHLKSKGNLWEMSEVSTKCNDSKVQQGCLNISELMKKNKQYQQIINNQRSLIQKLESIINQSYDLNNS